MNVIEKKITVNAPLSRVWKALTDPEELSQWMLMQTTFVPEINKDFTFKTYPGQEMQAFFKCKVIEIVQNKKLSFTWNMNSMDADTLVTIELKQAGNQTELTLVHTGWDNLPSETAEQMKESHSKGWDLRFCEKLKELIEG